MLRGDVRQYASVSSNDSLYYKYMWLARWPLTKVPRSVLMGNVETFRAKENKGSRNREVTFSKLIKNAATLEETGEE